MNGLANSLVVQSFAFKAQCGDQLHKTFDQNITDKFIPLYVGFTFLGITLFSEA